MVDVHLPPMANALLFRCAPILLVCTISAILSWYNIPRFGTGTGIVPVIALAGPWYNNRIVYPFVMATVYPYSPVPYELAPVNIAYNYALYARAYWAILH
jgi:hypothetical protein